MSFHFYLSYAPADYSENLCKFFEDLTCTIRARLPECAEEAVGFFPARGDAPRSEWTPEAAEALRTSRLMIALTSPEYFRSESSGKEWQIFETRRTRAARLGSLEAAGVIVPVIWIPCDETVPKAVTHGHDSLGHLNGAYRKYGVLTAHKTLHRFAQEYVNVLVALAEHVIAVTRTTGLLPLDVLPPFEEVDNAFHANYMQNGKYRAKAYDSPPPATKDEPHDRYRALVVEPHHQVRDMLLEYLSPDFEVEGYEEARQVPARALVDENQSRPIDLFVVDLELEARKRDGLSLIQQIRPLKTRPAVMAMSAGLSSKKLIEAMRVGAEVVVPKPFDVEETVKRMKKLAAIAKSRRLHRLLKSESTNGAPAKRERPVFLSYSSKDNESKRVAIFLKSNIEARGIGVWYSDEILSPEDSAPAKSVFEGIAEAQVFLPVITDSYPSSTPCLAELICFFNHQMSDRSRVLLPVLHRSAKEIKYFDWIKPLIDDRQHADLTSESFLDGLITVLGWIQKLVNGKTPLQS